MRGAQQGVASGKSHDKCERCFPDFRGRECTLLHRNNGTLPHVHVDGVPRRVQCEVLAFTHHLRPVKHIIPGALGEVSHHRGCIRSQHRGDQNVIPNEELGGHANCVCIAWERKEEGPHHGITLCVRLKVQRVQVRQQLVPQPQRLLRRYRDCGPKVQLLGAIVFVVMSSRERVKRACLDPPVAQILGDFTVEPTNVGSYHRDPHDPRIQNGHNGRGEVIPCGAIVPGPMSRILPGPQKRRSRKNEWPLSPHGRHGYFGGFRLRDAKQVVSVVLNVAIVMLHRHGRGPEVERLIGSRVVQRVWRVVVITVCILTLQIAIRVVWVDGSIPSATPGAKVGDFIHIDPHSIKRHLLMKPLNLFRPPLRRLGVEKIGEVDRTRPHLAHVILPVLVFQVNVLLQTAKVRPIVVISDADS